MAYIYQIRFSRENEIYRLNLKTIQLDFINLIIIDLTLIYLSLRHKINYNISDFIKCPYSDLLLTSIQAREYTIWNLFLEPIVLTLNTLQLIILHI